MTEFRRITDTITCKSGHVLYPSTTWPQRYPTTVDAIIICNRCTTSEIGRAGKISYKFYHCTDCFEDICPSCASRNDFNRSHFSFDRVQPTKKLLIIHPDDRSTDFLRILYENIAACDRTVITGGISPNELDVLIAGHDRVLMCGHGYKNGLLAMNKFETDQMYIINKRNVPLLKKSKSNVFIWCFASDFVEQFNLQGFSTGMFISEVEEAVFCGLTNPIPTQDEVDQSNELFCRILAKYLLQDISSEDLYRHVCQDYSELAETNTVAAYNLSLLRNY